MGELVTVAIAAYNVETYIGDMIESVLNQTYKYLEVLIVNDGATDGTRAICEQFNDMRIRIIDKENGGLSTARQTALDAAQGEFLCFVDGDDILQPQYVEKMYRLITETQADICVCEYQEFLNQPGEGRVVSLPMTEYNAITPELLEKQFQQMIVEFKLADSWNKMYRTEFLRSTGIRFFLEKKYNGTDLSFNHLLALHCPRYCVVHEVLLNYRLTPNSRVRRKDKDLQGGFMLITKALLEEVKKLGYNEGVRTQIYLTYLDMIRRAIADRHRNVETSADFKRKYSEFRRKHFEFCAENFSPAGYKEFTLGMRLFIALISCKWYLPMHMYLGSRDHKIKHVLDSEKGRV